MSYGNSKYNTYLTPLVDDRKLFWIKHVTDKVLKCLFLLKRKLIKLTGMLYFYLINKILYKYFLTLFLKLYFFKYANKQTFSKIEFCMFGESQPNRIIYFYK